MALTGRGGADPGEIEAVGEEKGGAQVKRADPRGGEERGESKVEGPKRLEERSDREIYFEQNGEKIRSGISLKRKVARGTVAVAVNGS